MNYEHDMNVSGKPAIPNSNTKLNSYLNRTPISNDEVCALLLFRLRYLRTEHGGLRSIFKIQLFISVLQEIKVNQSFYRT